MWLTCIPVLYLLQDRSLIQVANRAIMCPRPLPWIRCWDDAVLLCRLDHGRVPRMLSYIQTCTRVRNRSHLQCTWLQLWYWLYFIGWWLHMRLWQMDGGFPPSPLIRYTYSGAGQSLSLSCEIWMMIIWRSQLGVGRIVPVCCMCWQASCLLSSSRYQGGSLPRCHSASLSHWSTPARPSTQGYYLPSWYLILTLILCCLSVCLCVFWSIYPCV